jgi:hypothetical protein
VVQHAIQAHPKTGLRKTIFLGLQIQIAPGISHPNPNNSRAPTVKQIRQIAESLEIFQFNNPVLIDENMALIAGHGRLEAAEYLSLKAKPRRRISRVSRKFMANQRILFPTAFG